MNASMLEIKIWRNEIRVTREQRAAQAVQAQVDDITRFAQRELAAALDAYLQRKQGEVILVRSLEFDFDLDLACDPAHAARALAGHVTQQLVECIETAAPQVLRFKSWAAYAARFVLDLAAGTAWGRWYYDPFDGLRSLPTGAAIRTLLGGADTTGALAAIPAAHWPDVAAALDEAESWRLLDELAARPAPTDVPACEAPLLEALANRELREITGAPGIALAMLAACERAGLAIGAAAVQAAEVVASAAHAVWRDDLAPASGPLRDAWPPPAGARAAARVALHFAGERGRALQDLRRAAQRVGSATPEEGATHSCEDATPVEIASCAPGLGILLNELEGLRRAGLCGPPGFEASLLLAILATASGPERASATWDDAAWRATLGVDRRLTWSMFAQALAAAPESLDCTRAAHSTLAGHHSAGSAVHLRFRLATADPEGAILEPAVDLATGLWCSLNRTAADAETAPLEGAVRLAATRRARADFRALDNPLLHAGCPPAWRLAIMAGAQFAWRRVSQRVPGMLLASLPYLRSNLLGRRGCVVETGASTWHWCVARPPLHVLLAMTGITRPLRIGDRSIEIEWR
jgi:hypothetical protein